MEKCANLKSHCLSGRHTCQVLVAEQATYLSESSAERRSQTISFNAISTHGSFGFRAHSACLATKVLPWPSSLPVRLILEEFEVPPRSGDSIRKPASRLLTWQKKVANEPRAG